MPVTREDFTPLDVRPLHAGEDATQVWACKTVGAGCVQPPVEDICYDLRCAQCALMSYGRHRAERALNRGRISATPLATGPADALVPKVEDPYEVAVFALREFHGIEVTP